VRARIVAPLPGIDYFFVEKNGRRVRKHVDYFLLEYLDGDEATSTPKEVDAARWFPWEEAARAPLARQREAGGRAGARARSGRHGLDDRREPRRGAMRILLRILLNGVGLWAACQLLPGLHWEGAGSTCWWPAS